MDPAELLRERLGKVPVSGRLWVVGAGKACAAMAACLEEFLHERIAGGCVAVRDLPAFRLRKIDLLEAGHPVPDERSVHAATRILDVVQGLSRKDTVIVLVSGGATSLVALPKEGTIGDFARESQALLASGLPIAEVNRRRRALLRLADGGLARAAAPAKVLGFILSDVIGNDLATIGCGPTSVGPEQQERVQNVLIGDNALAVGGAVRAAMRLGFQAAVQPEPWTGEAAEAGRRFARSLLDGPPGTAWIAGGETTVALHRGGGIGGRCQEAALAAAFELSGKLGAALLFAGTDGSDGPTDAAGAFADGATLEGGTAAGLKAEDFLRRHDSHRFFERTGGLFRTGPTGTNVADLALGIRIPAV